MRPCAGPGLGVGPVPEAGPRLGAGPGVGSQIGEGPRPAVGPRPGARPRPGVEFRLGMRPRLGKRPRLRDRPRPGARPRLGTRPRLGAGPEPHYGNDAEQAQGSSLPLFNRLCLVFPTVHLFSLFWSKPAMDSPGSSAAPTHVVIHSLPPSIRVGGREARGGEKPKVELMG